MFRKATENDIDRIAEIYGEIHDEIEAGLVNIGWMREVYPNAKTAAASVQRGDMFVMEDGGQIVAAAIMNHVYIAEYAEVTWQYDVPQEQVMVLHTLVVSPKLKGKGYGTKFVAFYEDYARENGCVSLRMDTNANNTSARTLYQKLGYTEVAIVTSEFNGLHAIPLVCLEKKL